MRIFVDSLMPCLTSSRWRWPSACHLLSDNLPDLRVFAARLGLRPDWLQWSRGGTPHYDLSPYLRMRAVLLGAITITRTEAALLAQLWRRRNQAILHNLAQASFEPARARHTQPSRSKAHL